jgi:hypothetical protein
MRLDTHQTSGRHNLPACRTRAADTSVAATAIHRPWLAHAVLASERCSALMPAGYTLHDWGTA